MGSMVRLALSSIIILFFYTNLARTQDCEDRRRSALADITKFADDNCVKVNQTGNASSTEVKAGVDAGLTGYFARLIGVKGDARVDVSKEVGQYSGLVQEQLANAVSDLNKCKLHVLDVLSPTMVKDCPEPQPPQARPALVLCTGELRGNCPGRYDLYLGCPNITLEAQAAYFCPKGGKSSPLMTGIGGNGCGYGLFSIVCNE